MGFVDDQIRNRIKLDDEYFSDTFISMASVVLGNKATFALNDGKVQTEYAIKEILDYYHVKAQEMPENMDDVNDQLEFLLRPSGIMRRTVNLEGEWYKDAVGAFIGTRKDDGTVVAFIPDKIYGYKFFDYSKGEYVKVNKKNCKLFDVEAITFVKPFPQKKLGIADLLKMMFQSVSPSDYAFVAIALLITTLVGFLVPKINNIIYAYVIHDKGAVLFASVFILFICVGISQQLLAGVQQLIMSRIETKINVQVQAAAMSRLLSLPVNLFRDYSSGDINQRMDSIGMVCMMLMGSVFSMGLSSIFSLAYIGQMVKYGPGLVAPGIIVVLVTVAFSTVVVFLRMKINKKSLEIGAKEAGMEFGLVSGLTKIKLTGSEKRAFAKWGQLYKEGAKLTYDPPKIIALSAVVSTGLSLIGTVVMYYFAIKTGVSLADYFAFNAAYGMVTGAFIALLGISENIGQIKPLLEMAKPVLETVPEYSADKEVVTRISGAIELDNVTFKYTEKGPTIIDNLSLKIKNGEYVAIVGKTNCGKSTLMRLLLGFETPQKGAIYYTVRNDKKDISNIDLKSLRRNIGTVMQNGKLFTGDIFSNIVITAPWLTMEDAWEAAELAGIKEDIENMPMGMHTMISEGTGGISGGQRQRLMIARAIASKPKILMFDEATSALDNITQKKVSQSLASLKCTRIVIAHRLSTIKECDRILVLDGGKIIEEGSYEQLVAQNGFFAELVERQRLDVE